jgi:hypothetical protein
MADAAGYVDSIAEQAGNISQNIRCSKRNLSVAFVILLFSLEQQARAERSPNQRSQIFVTLGRRTDFWLY